MVNPFYVQPAQIDIDPLLSGIGSIVKQNRDANRRQQAEAEIMEASQSGDPVRMAEISIKYPEYSEAAKNAFGFTNKASEAAARETYRRALSDPDNAGQHLQQGIQQVLDARGRPDMMTRDFQMFQENPEQALQAIKMGYARLDPEGYKTLGGATDSKSPFQFGAQSTFKDAKGNLFFSTTKRDPNTGAVDSVVAALDGSEIKPVGKLKETGSYGLTASEKVNQIGQETTEKTRKTQNENARQGYIKAATSARSMIPDTKRLLELNNLISTGKTARARKLFGDVFGVTDPNLGEFNSRAGQLVLGSIRQLGANPTEGERAFLTEIMPSIEQGGAVNEAILNDLLRIQQRQVNRGKWFAQNPGATVEEFLLATDEEDFTPSAGAEQPEQQAPEAGSVISEADAILGL